MTAAEAAVGAVVNGSAAVSAPALAAEGCSKENKRDEANAPVDKPVNDKPVKDEASVIVE